MDNSKYFDKIPEIEEAKEKLHDAIELFLNEEISFEEYEAFQQAVSDACDKYDFNGNLKSTTKS
ncbi:hypothetical protein [Flavobacterium frigidarium]|jgi:hypothetical protein|uniref:hypothetical protein n=1 Tax=Flavobacterium frigidarium TaxID=99286 RepID=UPI0004001D3B|nr:hypothetical protein [Flavobacterium frigidarium]